MSELVPERAAEAAADTVEPADACGTGGSCDDCVFGCNDAPPTACGHDGGTATAEERLTIAASGGVITLIAATVVATGGGALHLTLAGVTVLGGLLLAVLGVVATLRGGALGDRLLARATRVLPYVTGALILGLTVRLVTFVAGLL